MGEIAELEGVVDSFSISAEQAEEFSKLCDDSQSNEGGIHHAGEKLQVVPGMASFALFYEAIRSQWKSGREADLSYVTIDTKMKKFLRAGETVRLNNDSLGMKLMVGSKQKAVCGYNPGYSSAFGPKNGERSELVIDSDDVLRYHDLLSDVLTKYEARGVPIPLLVFKLAGILQDACTEMEAEHGVEIFKPGQEWLYRGLKVSVRGQPMGRGAERYTVGIELPELPLKKRIATVGINCMYGNTVVYNGEARFAIVDKKVLKP